MWSSSLLHLPVQSYNRSGGPLNESVVSRSFTKSIKKLGLRKIRLYDLRHGHITELLNDGVPDKQIQERVGHASATMTKDRYGHFVVGAQEQSILEWESQRFAKTSDSEDGASDRNRTCDKRFTKPLMEILSHLISIGQIAQQYLSYVEEDNIGRQRCVRD